MEFDPDYVRANHDGIIIPAANWLIAQRDTGKLASLIERADLPTVLVGIGGQSFTGKIPNLHPNTKRFLHVVSERSHSIAARGTFTAEVLAHNGVKNAVVTGCPSLLWHVKHPASVTRTVPTQPTKVGISGTRHEDFDKDPETGAPVPSIGMALLRLAYSRGFDYIAQTEFDLLRIARGEPASADEPKQVGEFLGEHDPARVTAYLKQHARVFSDVPSWIEYNATRDFIFGMRLHGVISSLLAGTPALLLIHDTRTREMALEAGIPHVETKELEGKPIDVEALAERADFRHFNAVQEKYFKRFTEFFAKNGVATNLPN
ncbi:polysaccharide pyruvyl transferase family protein [Roseomonas sp. GC11]|uniref:polysaccharide pyruvyl transferase family protein n=1 Tax=Roseomonas sp. GC11 TaxID=2950546 RepID=UPI00210C0D58|nr:polysaccharide pyruvyl transferase family protein [Roseomonas sp. GC11]MCQ4161232.1 polysaccharide pyruvyl transferase family protein [Roseomonas sp. GC11]